MPEAPAWFDRKFDVPYPAELLPSLLVRLRGAPARLDEMMRRGARASLIAKPDGKWSAQENAGHLLDIEPLWLARIDDYVAGRKALTPADLGNRAMADANYHAVPLDRILADFRAARETLVRRATTAPPSAFADAIPHPRLGTPMKLPDHLHLVAEHDDHHLARIWALLETRA